MKKEDLLIKIFEEKRRMHFCCAKKKIDKTETEKGNWKGQFRPQAIP
jgi:hypothetical protein